jgi:glyoxylase I family protein
MQPLGIHHVNITVGDMTAARTFYLEKLGLRERTDRPQLGVDGAWLDLGPQQVHLVLDPAFTKSASTDHFAIVVADIDSAVTELRSYGVRVSEPMGVNRSRQAFLRDPWGNRLELQQPG